MAVACYNDGAHTAGNIMKRCNLNLGRYMYVSEAADKEDGKRIYTMGEKIKSWCFGSKTHVPGGF